MKVLWLTNHILPEHAQALGLPVSPRAGWMLSLANLLAENPGIELGIATNVLGQKFSVRSIGNKRYYTIDAGKGVTDYRSLSPVLIGQYRQAVADFKPDVLHIHGTEYFLGLLTGRKHLQVPTVISIQGILDAYRGHYYGGLSFGELLRSRTLRDWVCFDGLIEQKWKMTRRSRWEMEIFATNSTFIGRTQWDRVHTMRLNPQAQYHHCEEVLRPAFYQRRWTLSGCDRHTIYASSGSYPLKGLHVLIEAIALLRDEFPAVQLRVPLAGMYHEARGREYLRSSLRSGGYARYLTRLVERLHVGPHIRSLGTLDEAQVADELRKAHVFALPSFIENSPNSLAEAMLVGTPSVAAFVGGVPSMVRDGESALCFPTGDAAMLADQIRRIFVDDTFAQSLSHSAVDMASARHSKEEVVADMCNIYRSCL